MLISDQPQGCGNPIAKLTKDINAFCQSEEYQANIRDTKNALASKPLIIGDNIKIVSFPNPFTTSTTLDFYMPEEGVVNLNIYDAVGRIVETVINEEDMSLGRYNYNVLQDVSNGFYFAKIFIRHENGNISQKTIKLLKQ